MLSADAAELFLHITRFHDWTVESASAELGMCASRVEHAKQQLYDLRLLAPLHADGGRLVATAPDIALAELVSSDERRINDLRASVARRRRALMALLPAYSQARQSAVVSEHAEVAEDAGTFLTLLMDTGWRATRDVLVAQPGAGFGIWWDEEPGERERDHVLLEHGVVRRTILQAGRRSHVETQRAVAELEPLGGEFRTLGVVPFGMVVFDRQLALVARAQDASDRAALVIRDPAVVATYAAIFDAAWGFATPFGASGALRKVVPCEEVEALQKAILAGLSIGLTDDALAGRLGISVRTCRRHISSLFDQLGAKSRFQAGALAAERGLIPPSTKVGTVPSPAS